MYSAWRCYVVGTFYVKILYGTLSKSSTNSHKGMTTNGWQYQCNLTQHNRSYMHLKAKTDSKVFKLVLAIVLEV